MEETRFRWRWTRATADHELVSELGRRNEQCWDSLSRWCAVCGVLPAGTPGGEAGLLTPLGSFRSAGSFRPVEAAPYLESSVSTTCKAIAGNPTPSTLRAGPKGGLAACEGINERVLTAAEFLGMSLWRSKCEWMHWRRSSQT